MTPNLLTLFRQIYVSLYWHLFGQILSLALIALHLQYIGSGPAAVPVELPDQLLHLGQAEVGDDHQVAAGQVLLAVAECTETPQYSSQLFLRCEQRGEELASSYTCAAVIVQRQELHRNQFSQHMFESYVPT